MNQANAKSNPQLYRPAIRLKRRPNRGRRLQSEPQRAYRRHSSFSIGLHGQNWLDLINFFQDVVRELLSFYSHKRPYYLKGMRTASHVQYAL